MSRAERIEINKKKIQKRKLMEKYVPYWVQSYKLPNKIEEEYEKLEDEAWERDNINGFTNHLAPGAEWAKVVREYRRVQVEQGYLKPKNSSKRSQFIKKHSRRHLRTLTKEELRKDPEEIGTKTGNNENKYHEYDWELD